MRRFGIVLIILCVLIEPVSAMDFTAPDAPEGAQCYMPEDTDNFGESLWYVISKAFQSIGPDVYEAFSVCLRLIACVIMIQLVASLEGKTGKVLTLAGSVAVSLILLQPSNTLLQLGTETVESVSAYGKILLPVMTAAMAAQGYTNTSAALYTATAFFDALLAHMISRLLTPMLYLYVCICIAGCAIQEEALLKLKKFIKWAVTWSLKIVLYVFTGYISITGVVSGSTDAMLVKAAKLTISGAVPFVGGLMADASETIVASAGFMKNTAGVFGLLAVISTCIGPFLKIGVQYLLLKTTGGICNMLGTKQISGLIDDFSAVMGYLLAMTGAVCLLLMISIACFMKGVL